MLMLELVPGLENLGLKPGLKKKMVRTGRLELPHLSILEPKSSASTNSATSAALNQKNMQWSVKGGALYPISAFCQALVSEDTASYTLSRIIVNAKEQLWLI